MAKMIPDFGPAETDSPSEPLVYSQLKSQLSDDFIVIHSLPWLSAAVRQLGGEFRPPTGEIDFLILHPDLGILAIEVKGGRYRIEGAAFVLMRNNQHIGVVKQTRDNVHGLARWLAGNSSLRCRIGYAMCFPDSSLPTDSLPPSLVDASIEESQSIVLDMSAMVDLGAKVLGLMRYWGRALQTRPLGPVKIAQLVKALCPNFDGTPDWGLKVQYDNHFWLRLTPQQASVTNKILTSEKFIVTGWPGTGKTLIGIEAARRLHKAGRRVLVLTFNSLLSEYWGNQLNETNCTVLTWHKLCRIARSKLGLSLLDDAEFREWSQGDCVGDLSAAIDQGLLDSYDSLILDEAQALKPRWCAVLATWFADRQMIALCDETQVFAFEKDSTTLATLSTLLDGVLPFHMTVVMRMPKAVTDRLQEVRSTQLQLSTPRMLEIDTVREMVVEHWEDVLPIITGDLFERGIAPGEITVLSKFGFERLPKSIQHFLLEHDGIQVQAISRFRGMESPIVMIICAEELSDIELFCAYSRATTVCMSMFSAEYIGRSGARGFLEKILTMPANINALTNIRHRLHPRTLLAGHQTKKLTGIETINLTWCYSLECWLVQHERGSSMSLWLEHLVRSHPWPALTWFEDSLRSVVLARADSDKEAYFRELDLEYCVACDRMTPATWPARSCLVCHGDMGNQTTSLTQRLALKLIDFDEKIRSLLNSSSWSEILATRNELPFFLATAALGEYAFRNNRQPQVFDRFEPSGESAIYRAAQVLVTAWLMLLSAGTKFELSEISIGTYHQDLEELGFNSARWRSTVALAINVHLRAENVVKLGKGIYVVA
ncbi:AAA family ATPase [Janthinobacterium sp. SUN137]|uniref:AAA family ATPase n=1 Tax=Janthinobacterium sp. SUN137 TaxID=3014789 RepID=UPI002712CEAC|nr:AAA family ATPase [Janthinobacterium sp. SUN137]MDO8040362.1 AAA family ATPase [Janthinobacterium sp. SUN137]